MNFNLRINLLHHFEHKQRMKKIIQLGILILAVATFYNARAQAQADSSGTVMELREYAIDHVQGKKPFKYRDADNKLKESKTAYLVTFTFVNELKTTNTMIDFYIGDYRIPE